MRVDLVNSIYCEVFQPVVLVVVVRTALVAKSLLFAFEAQDVNQRFVQEARVVQLLLLQEQENAIFFANAEFGALLHDLLFDRFHTDGAVYLHRHRVFGACFRLLAAANDLKVQLALGLGQVHVDL